MALTSGILLIYLKNMEAFTRNYWGALLPGTQPKKVNQQHSKASTALCFFWAPNPVLPPSPRLGPKGSKASGVPRWVWGLLSSCFETVGAWRFQGKLRRRQIERPEFTNCK